MWNHKNVKLYFFLICLVLGVIIFRTYIFYLIISIIISMLGSPIVAILQKLRIKNFGISKTFASAITLLIFVALFVIIVLNVIPLISSQIDYIKNLNIDYQKLNKEIESICTSIQSTIDHYKLGTSKNFDFQAFITQKFDSIISAISFGNIMEKATSMLTSIFVGVFAVLLLSFFLLKEENLVLNLIYSITPSEFEENIRNIIKSSALLLRRYFVGLIFQMFEIFIGVFIGMMIIGLSWSDSMIIALIDAVFVLIPYIGPLIGAGLGILLAVIFNLDPHSGVDISGLIYSMPVVYVVVHMIDNFVFQPFVFSKRVKAHPLEIFFVILIYGKYGGIFGMIIAIPTYTIIRVFAKEFFGKHRFIYKLTKQLDEDDTTTI